MSAQQLTIPLEVNRLCDFASFVVGGNAEAISAVAELARAPGDIGVWLWGTRGCGRSHLLQAACQDTAQRGRRALYLPLAALPDSPAVLDGLHADLLAVDDVDAWLGNQELEAALMALYQRQLGEGGSLLLSAAAAPGQLDFALPDLDSRCRALTVYPLLSLDDAGLKAVLKGKARQRGLKLGEATLDFWLARSRRSLPTLLDELELLDRAALRSKRRLTIPLIKEVLRL